MASTATQYWLGHFAGRCGYKYGEGYSEVPDEYRRGYIDGWRRPELPTRALDEVLADKSWSF